MILQLIIFFFLILKYISQTNTVSSAQRRKMRGFGDFRRMAVVIIPSDEELKKRCDVKVETDCKPASEHSVNEMKGKFFLMQNFS